MKRTLTLTALFLMTLFPAQAQDFRGRSMPPEMKEEVALILSEPDYLGDLWNDDYLENQKVFAIVDEALAKNRPAPGDRDHGPDAGFSNRGAQGERPLPPNHAEMNDKLKELLKDKELLNKIKEVIKEDNAFEENLFVKTKHINKGLCEKDNRDQSKRVISRQTKNLENDIRVALLKILNSPEFISEIRIASNQGNSFYNQTNGYARPMFGAQMGGGFGSQMIPHSNFQMNGNFAPEMMQNRAPQMPPQFSGQQFSTQNGYAMFMPSLAYSQYPMNNSYQMPMNNNQYYLNAQFGLGTNQMMGSQFNGNIF